MSIGRTLYWLFTGALFGFGFIAILSIGLPFILLGLVLVVVGAIWMRDTGFWAALVGFGGVPAAILLWDVTSAPWACDQSGSFSAQPNVNYFTCLDTFAGQLTSYHVLAFGFGVIALLGIICIVLQGWWNRRVHRRQIQG